MIEFPFRLPNFKHQQQEFDRHRDDDFRALLWGMRTGKTKSVIDVACYRHVDRRDVDGLLVLAPNGVHVNWVRRQLPQHMWEMVDWEAHAWQASEAHKRTHQEALERVLAYRGGLAVLAVNSESLRYDKVKAIVKRFLRGRKVFLVADESHDFRSPGAKRTKTARGIAKHCTARRILSGTSVSNSPLAAYSQFEIVKPGALGFGLFADFEAEYAVWGTATKRDGQKYPVLEGYKNLEDLQGRIAQWSSVVLREDVDDMPELLPMEVTVSLSEEHMEAYRTLAREWILELEGGGEVEALDAGVRLMKLQQVISGFIIDERGDVRQLVNDDENPRIEALLREVQAPGKHIVWCKYQEDLRRVTAALTAAGRNPVEYHGRIHSQARRQAAIDSFMDPNSGVTDFVGQPAAGGEGLDLSAAGTIHWYSHTFDLIERDQANERATQIGGRSIAVLDYVVPGTVDEYILKTLEGKRSIADELAGRGLRDRLLGALRAML